MRAKPRAGPLNSPSRRWFQEPLVWMLIAIPFSSVCVGGAMLWLAIENEDGLVVDDYYKQGMEINRTLERDAAAVRYALESDLRFISETGQVVATIQGGQDFSYPESVTFGIYHVVKPGFDREIRLSRISDNAYAGPVPDLLAGNWNASLYSDDWRLTGRIHWPTERAALSSTD